ncbi:hypothetical protein KM043_014628 [Ampulex compressa]|nr:hypothetical protein KM043_014628 [Ampulex compressa]
MEDAFAATFDETGRSLRTDDYIIAVYSNARGLTASTGQGKYRCGDVVDVSVERRKQTMTRGLQAETGSKSGILAPAAVTKGPGPPRARRVLSSEDCPPMSTG